jgi:hypothetical protein
MHQRRAGWPPSFRLLSEGYKLGTNLIILFDKRLIFGGREERMDNKKLPRCRKDSSSRCREKAPKAVKTAKSDISTFGRSR